MRLSRLRLNGFKSFADPTELRIEPGLTGVVGPNGCGKSNLLEGLRWVMGETRPSQMRGEGMADVIFAGTRSRPPKARAEVALAFERDGAEVELVRRIARDGGSGYRLNGREARLRDVQAMFADAAAGAQSPSLVRQGQIGELIAARPGARRRVIEEAAGVAGLQVRRAEAAQRLAAAEANLARLAELREGLEERLRGLERQARAARRWREVAAELREAEGALLWRVWSAAEEAARAAEGEARLREGLARRAEAAATEAVAARERAEAALPPLRDRAAGAGEALAGLRAEVEALAAAGRAADGRAREARAALEEIARDEAREAALDRDAEAQLARLAGEIARLDRAGEGEGERIAAAGRAAEAAERAVETAEARHLRLAESAARAAAEAGAAAARVREAGMARDRAGAEAARAASALAEAEGAVERAQRLRAAASEASAAAEAARTAAEAALAEAEAALPVLREGESAARTASAAARAEAAGLEAQARALARAVEADGPREGVGAALRVPEGFEGAAVAALGDGFGLGVAEGDGAGWHRLPDLTAAPWPEGVQPLAALVTGPPEVARRLAHAGLVPDEAAAARLWPLLGPGQRLVTAEGALWRWDGVHLPPGEAAGEAAEALRRAARLPVLRAEAAQASALAGEAAAQERTAREALAAAEARAEAARGALRAAERQAAEGARALGRAEADGALAEARGEAARAARAAAQQAAEAAGAALTAALAAQAALPDPQAARAEAAAAQSQAQAARAALMAARGEAEGLRRAAEGRARRRAELAKEDALWRGRREAAGTRAADLAARRTRAQAMLEQAEAEPGRLAAQAARAQAAVEGAEAARAAAQAALAEREAALRAAQDAERGAERAASEAREARAGAEAARAAAAERAAAALLALTEGAGEGPAALLDRLGGRPEALPPEGELRARIEALRRRRDQIGAVNLRAEEDARALAAEAEVLQREGDDLAAAVAELRRALQALNREGRERMLAAFERVNAEFGRLFAALFGGGEARLAFVEGDDPLEAGVEIMAQPPGKTLGTLSLLSGGEQTLTALALIFAVFLVAPAPVCVLDEVDAPLDDANVGRFCDLLDAMVRDTRTRFLVITHHAVTMARMDRLYGVTMAERGVSQLVSVDLRAAEAMVA
jgi:chromosome segregation protein